MPTVSEMYDYLLRHSKDTDLDLSEATEKQIRIEYQVVKAMNGGEK